MSNDGFTLNIKKIQARKFQQNQKQWMWRSAALPWKSYSPVESKAASVKLRLQERKYSLYDANHIPKLKNWASNEFDFLAQHLQTLENLDKKVSSLYCCISNTYKILSSRFTRDTVPAQEKKRVKRRKKEQKRKKIKRQKKYRDETSPQVACEKHMEKKWQIRSWRVVLSRNCLLNNWGP